MEISVTVRPSSQQATHTHVCFRRDVCVFTHSVCFQVDLTEASGTRALFVCVCVCVCVCGGVCVCVCVEVLVCVNETDSRWKIQAAALLCSVMTWRGESHKLFLSSWLH